MLFWKNFLEVMEGMIKELYDMYLQMIECIDHEINYLKVSGNAIRKNEILRKICEDIFSLSSKLSEYEEEAASGAALNYKYKRMGKLIFFPFFYYVYNI